MTRVGLGQDAHFFSENSNKKLMLGGYLVDGEKGLEGDSDGDVAIHALCRAVEQALGNPDFHSYAGKMCQDGISDSRQYLRVAMKHIKEKKYQLINVGLTFECQKPRISLVAEKIKAVLAEIMGIKKDQIGINSSSGDGLTAFGQGKGIQCFAMVNLIRENEKS